MVVGSEFNNTADVDVVAILLTLLNADYFVIKQRLVSACLQSVLNGILFMLSLYYLYFHHVTRCVRHINVATVVR
ncbi:CFF_collapsed_G0026600.mRNA.1.CDS.1 [Saccharomyces cerevisiae]|nr:CFF_collapsed_G0026600.mRNA.1.CDS.1 [Saccharomyces cerevisiae]